jgi:phosphoribosyl-ATP pyrophosphohydrolase
VILAQLETVLRERLTAAPAGSYSVTLLRDPALAAAKIIEEAGELAAEVTAPSVDRRRVVEEAADVLFHVLAGLVGAGVPLDDVLDELEARRR